MNKNKINYWVDFLLLILGLFIAVTGLILKFVFVSGQPGVGRRITFLGMDKMDIIPWHSAFGIVMIVLIIVHLALHLNWIKSMTVNIFSRKAKSC